MAIEVIKPGLATSVQDAGRPGYYNIGIPLSGALDQYALRAANLLVGNEEGAAALEATLLAPELVFRSPAIVAVTGAEAAPKLNGEARPRNEFFAVKARRPAQLRLHENRRARLYRGCGRNRRSGRFSAAARLMRWARWAVSPAASLPPATCCRSANRAPAHAPAAHCRRTRSDVPKVARTARAAGAVLPSDHGRVGEVVLRRYLDRRAGSRPHWLSLPQGDAACVS